MNPKKLDTITKWPLPTSAREIQSFLGFTNFYRKSVHNYAKLTLPGTSLTTKGCKLNFPGVNEAAQQAFEELKLAFTTPPRPWCACTTTSATRAAASSPSYARGISG
jgi:hypothetical protein